MKSRVRIISTYAIFGFAFGLLFPIIALAMDSYFRFGEIDFFRIQELVANNPIHYIIFSAPFILSFIFFILGKSYYKQYALSENLGKLNVQLKDSNELLDTFSYHISHDLKSTMNNQIGLSDMMSKYLAEAKYEKVAEIMNMMTKVASDGQKMIERFLSISKSGFNWNEESDETANVKDVIDQVVSKLKINAELKLVYNSSEYETLNIRTSTLESILLNLFSNSIKYNDNDVEIKVELIKRGGKKLVTISDNGIGFDMEKHGAKIFNPFYRASNSVGKEGTGVGLFIVKKLIHANMGEIVVSSKIGKGTTFTLSFEG